MLVTFADGHSALSVLDVDGMKVGHAWSLVERELLNPCGLRVLSCGRVVPSPHLCLWV